MIEQSDYVVIATITKKSPKIYMDGWIKYHCRFIYWLKIPGTSDSLTKVQQTIEIPRIKPVPLYTLDQPPYHQPPGAPPTSDVVLVDEHELSYHRLLEKGAENQNRPDVGRPLHNTYVLLFLNKADDDKGYTTTGVYHSILPVSPLLDITRIPTQPHILDMELANAQSRIKMNTAETVRHILRDYMSYKKKELTLIENDLIDVLKIPAPEK